MLKNYFKIAIRNLLRYKGFTLINILSLAIGITGCLLIGLFVWDELQYDKFIKGADNIHRFYTTSKESTSNTSTASVPPMFATYAKQKYPEVEQATRILMFSGKLLLQAGNVKAYEQKGMFVDSTFFSIFPLPFIKGDRATALNSPTSIVITQNVAKKYFGDADPLGKRIRIDTTDFQVMGLVDVPEKFHLDISYIMPMSAAQIPAERMERWTWQQFFTYVKLKEGTDADKLEKKFQQVVKTEVSGGLAQADVNYVPFLQPLKDIHLHSSEFIYDNAKKGNADYVKGLTIIALFVLLIGCFNFINLATARSARRAKEIGVRKVMGADKQQLMLQFTGETILLSVIALLLSLALTLLILPSLNNFTGKSIPASFLVNPLMLLCLGVVAIVIGIMAGIYPALVMSSFQPVKVLKGVAATPGKSNAPTSLRQILVITQFAISGLLIICASIVYRQIDFLHNKDLGFVKEQVVYFDVHDDVEKRPEAFKQELLRSPGIVSATYGYGLPGDQLAGDGVKIQTKDGEKDQSSTLFVVEHDYIRTMGLQLIAGRDFSKDNSTDVDHAFIINETAVKEFGYGSAEKAIGQQMGWEKWVPDSLNPVKRGTVIGVVKDFHYKSLHETVNPAVLHIYPEVIVKFAVKVKTANLPGTLNFIETSWNKFSTGYPLEFNFLDENFDKMYRAEDKLSSLLWIFTIMAVLVGCMGLFGLAAFTAEQRVKEIGIRKVLGASAFGIVSLLTKSFLKPIVIASVIAFPLAWWAMQTWLKDFPYRVDISWWIFGLAGIAALLIAFITISFQAIRAGLANPIKSLRIE